MTVISIGKDVSFVLLCMTFYSRKLSLLSIIFYRLIFSLMQSLTNSAGRLAK
jgi:hypothetical protein